MPIDQPPNISPPAIYGTPNDDAQAIATDDDGHPIHMFPLPPGTVITDGYDGSDVRDLSTDNAGHDLRQPIQSVPLAITGVYNSAGVVTEAHCVNGRVLVFMGPDGPLKCALPDLADPNWK